MLVVDAQVRIWAASTPERPWPARHQPHKPDPIFKDEEAFRGFDHLLALARRPDIAVKAS